MWWWLRMFVHGTGRAILHYNIWCPTSFVAGFCPRGSRPEIVLDLLPSLRLFWMSSSSQSQVVCVAVPPFRHLLSVSLVSLYVVKEETFLPRCRELIVRHSLSSIVMSVCPNGRPIVVSHSPLGRLIIHPSVSDQAEPWLMSCLVHPFISSLYISYSSLIFFFCLHFFGVRTSVCACACACLC